MISTINLVLSVRICNWNGRYFNIKIKNLTN
nr:MAG TPA: hypothetical protein [Caudoviricetes sp.]